MAEQLRRLAGRLRASVRVRATLAALAVLTVVLVGATVALLVLQRAALREGVADAVELRAEQVAGQVATRGPAAVVTTSTDDDPEDQVVQVRAGDEVVATSQQGVELPADEDVVHLPGADADHAVATSEVEHAGQRHVVVVAESLEEADESTDVLVPLLLLGLPAVLLVAGAVIWLAVGRGLRPVERMRQEVDAISDSRLDRRIEPPGSRDEVQALAETMNALLARLQAARDRQRRFVSDASHELRSPLASLRQAGEVARSHPGAIAQEELADTVLAETSRLQRLVDQLLLLTRTDEVGLQGLHEEVDLDDVLLAEARRLRHEHPRLAVDTGSIGPARVRGSAVGLTQVVRNLVDNAARHAGSRVALATGQEDGRVVLSVADDGPGIPDEERERVFERFVRLDDARSRDAGGSGLGLAIVREVVRAHGGTVHVAAGPGATVVVDLPRA